MLSLTIETQKINHSPLQGRHLAQRTLAPPPLPLQVQVPDLLVAQPEVLVVAQVLLAAQVPVLLAAQVAWLGTNKRVVARLAVVGQ